MRIIHADMVGEADVTFIIPVFNEEKYLPYTLESIVEQRTDLTAEVVLVDDNSTDSTVTIAERYNCTVFANVPKKPVTEMRNFGYERSHGKAIFHLDGDVAMSPNYIERMVRPIVAGRCDATLCFWHEPLEVKYKVLPEKYSKSYAWFLQKLPHFFWGKIPVRLIKWLGRWFSEIANKKRLVSLFSIPDRVNGAAIIVRREIPEMFGGWKKAFGAHSDTDYTENIFRHASAVRWITGVTLYYSCRRHFPKDEGWFFRKLFRIKRLHKVLDKEKGYIDPKGVR